MPIISNMFWVIVLNCILVEPTFGNLNIQIWIRSTFNVDQDVKCCISLAANSVGLKEIPIYKVEMHDNVDWIKKSQVMIHATVLLVLSMCMYICKVHRAFSAFLLLTQYDVFPSYQLIRRKGFVELSFGLVFLEFQESFHPVEITEGLWIVPEWRNPPVRFHEFCSFIPSRHSCRVITSSVCCRISKQQT